MAQEIKDEEFLELSGEESLEDVQQLTLRNNNLRDFLPYCSKLPNLSSLSLSHNRICSLEGFSNLQNLVTLNLNFNALTSLAGLESCTQLEQLHAANNRIRDLQPLSSLLKLHTLNLFSNNVSSLPDAVPVLAKLPELRDLELGGNPCSIQPEYKHHLILILQLKVLDGTNLSDLDKQLAQDFYSEDPTSQPTAITTSQDPTTSNVANLRPPTPCRPPLPPTDRPLTAPSPSPHKPSLFSDNALNNNPLVLEYLARHVFETGMSLTTRKASSQGRNSFVSRLRDTTATMHACELLSAQDINPTHITPPSRATLPQSRIADARALMSASTPHETVQHLVKLCETLIGELQLHASKEEVQRCASGSEAHSCQRPGSGAESSGVAELEKLQRKVRQLELENENMYWIIDENRRLKARLGELGEEL